MSKAALAAYARYAAEELTGPGVTVNVVHPGYVATEASGGMPPSIPALLARAGPQRQDRDP